MGKLPKNLGQTISIMCGKNNAHWTRYGYLFRPKLYLSLFTTQICLSARLFRDRRAVAGRWEGGGPICGTCHRKPVLHMRLQYLLLKRGVSPSLDQTARKPDQTEHVHILNSEKRGQKEFKFFNDLTN